MRYIFIPILIFFTTVSISAQVTPNQETTTQNQQQPSYILKDIVVDGVKKYSPAQILRFTGLSKGEMVDIPGQKISNAIKKLWETDSFSEVEVYVEDIDGQSVVLKFHLQDLMELGEVKFTGKGIGKSKNEKLAKDNNLKPGTKITNNLISTLSNKIPEEYRKKVSQMLKLPFKTK
jgi:outer membrane protein insertion porin family